jgi:hypothetical protein
MPEGTGITWEGLGKPILVIVVMLVLLALVLMVRNALKGTGGMF